MTADNLHKIMSGAVLSLQRPKYGIRVDLEPEMPLGEGSTRMIKGNVMCYAGIGDLENIAPDFEIDDGKAMDGIAALFHEACGHGMQLGVEFRKAGPLQKALCANYLACQGSQRYYGIDDDNIPHDPYFQQPYEIAAQYMGVKCAKIWMDSVVGPDESERLMLAYAVHRKDIGYAFLPDGSVCSSTEDILKALDSKFQAVLNTGREFEPDVDDQDVLTVFSKCANFDLQPIVVHGTVDKDVFKRDAGGDAAEHADTVSDQGDDSCALECVDAGPCQNEGCNVACRDDEIPDRDDGRRTYVQESGLRQDVRIAAATKWVWENAWTWMDKSVFNTRAAKALPLRVDQAFLKDGTPFILAPSKLTALDRLKAINAKSDRETVFGKDADSPEPGG